MKRFHPMGFGIKTKFFNSFKNQFSNGFGDFCELILCARSHFDLINRLLHWLTETFFHFSK